MINKAVCVGLIGALGLILGGCASTGGEQPAAAAPPAPQVAPPAKPAGVSQAEIEARQMKEARERLVSRSIFFDFDKSEIKPEYQETLTQQADILKRYPDISVTLEGNADDRGSKEYNLALGQRRSEAVRQALKLLGIPDSRMEAISFGEEKPRATCPEEKCWSQNRRVDFTIKH